MAYVIIGATGHIGNNLVRFLVKNKEDVTVLARRIDKNISELNIKYVVCDIFSDNDLRKNICTDDIVIHLAGIIDIKNKLKQETYDINYLGTVKITDICLEKKVKKYIYCSSVDAIYKCDQTSIIREPEKMEITNFHYNYPKTKAMATQYVLDRMKEQNETLISIVYPSAVIGVHDYKPSMIGKVVKDCIDNKAEFGVKGGYNFIDVDDVCNAIYKITKSNISDTFILSGFNVTVFELYQMINKELGKKRRIWKIPMWIVRLISPFVPYLSKFTIETILENHNYDSTKAQKLLNWQLTPFDQTVRKTIKWFKKE